MYGWHISSIVPLTKLSKIHIGFATDMGSIINQQKTVIMIRKYPITEAVVLFCFNFPNYHDVIKYISEHQETCSYDHLLAKWEKFADVYSLAEAWLRFYMDCDEEIREAMTDYIMEEFAPRSGNFNLDELMEMNSVM